MNWGYVAGFLDGEGSVVLQRQNRNKGDGAGGAVCRLSFYNTNSEVLFALRDFIGAGRVTWRDHSGYGSKKPAGVLDLTSKDVLVKVLQETLPHLIIKREKAEALLKYLEEHVNADRMLNFGKVAAISNEQLERWHFDEGKTLGEIARALGVGPSAVSIAFKKRGITPNPRKSTKGIPKSEETRQRMKAAAQRRAASARQLRDT